MCEVIRQRIGRQRNHVSILGKVTKFFSYSKLPNGLSDVQKFLFSWYGGKGEGEGGENVKMAAHFHLIARLKMSGVSWRA